ncbi:hypothetical protein [Gryllotalpicola koreensis]|uniref:Uncharacterized protein n=1 Tax=Gryllotalpicola koreensis TaxID=993086 RepID=A0ABP8A2Q1_9MICO
MSHDITVTDFYANTPDDTPNIPAVGTRMLAKLAANQPELLIETPKTPCQTVSMAGRRRLRLSDESMALIGDALDPSGVTR